MSNHLFEANIDRQSETLTTIAFVLSIFGLLFSIFTDYIFGFLIYILIYAFAARGLKTKKQGLAIAAMLITSISVLVFIIKFIAIID